jgi:8-oxo-dGTP diphosphatase
MPHLHDKIDLTVAAYITHDNKILMIKHKKLQKWLPPGGHVELDQDPEEALFNEIAEETGLVPNQLTILSSKPHIESPGTKFLHTPNFLDIHDISDTHKHIGLTYILKTTSDKITLAEREHDDIKWFSIEDINSEEYDLLPAVKFYALQALQLN